MTGPRPPGRRGGAGSGPRGGASSSGRGRGTSHGGGRTRPPSGGGGGGTKKGACDMWIPLAIPAVLFYALPRMAFDSLRARWRR